jgi:parvulin-like peptidyl-prolyl isomerase
VWHSAHAEARQIFSKLQAGADFADLARLHSGDRSAESGGQMDYTHRGMLPEAVQGLTDKLKLHQVAEPVQLLEGVAILRLDERRGARARRFDEVRERAADLWQRDEGQVRWTKLIAELRQATVIRIDESHYVLPRSTTEKPRAG